MKADAYPKITNFDMELKNKKINDKIMKKNICLFLFKSENKTIFFINIKPANLTKKFKIKYLKKRVTPILSNPIIFHNKYGLKLPNNPLPT